MKNLFQLFFSAISFILLTGEARAGVQDCAGLDYCVYGQMPLYNQGSSSIQNGIIQWLGRPIAGSCVPTSMSMVSQAYGREYNVGGNAAWGDIRWQDGGWLTGLYGHYSGLTESGTRFDKASSILLSYAHHAGATTYEAGGRFNLLAVQFSSNMNNTFRNKKTASLVELCVGGGCDSFVGQVIHPCLQGRCHAVAYHGVTGGASILFDPWGTVNYVWQSGDMVYHGGGWGFVGRYGGSAQKDRGGSVLPARSRAKKMRFHSLRIPMLLKIT
jgi:hypothetical protein